MKTLLLSLTAILVFAGISVGNASAFWEEIQNPMAQKSGKISVHIVPGSIKTVKGESCQVSLEVDDLISHVSLTQTADRPVAVVGTMRYCGQHMGPNVDALLELFKGVDHLIVDINSDLHETIYVTPDNVGTPEAPNCSRSIGETVQLALPGGAIVRLDGGGHNIPGLAKAASCRDLRSDK
ncbi:MAG: hypothetical protein ACXWQO_02460 [Bdellovibrionota bacterium]